MMISALRSFSVNWPTWRCSFRFSSCSGLRLDFGPRFCGVSASWMPLAPSRRRGGFGFFEDALFVLSCVGPPLRFGHHFWIWSRAQNRIGARFGYRSTALRLAPLPFAPFRDSQTPRRKNNTKRIPVHLFPFLSRPTH